MNKSIACLMFYFLVSCSNSPRTSEVHKSGQQTNASLQTMDVPKYDYRTLDIKSWHQEYLKLDSTFLDHKIPLLANKKDFVRVLGMPDRVENIPIELVYRNYLGCENSNKANYWFYGKNIFLVIGEKAIFNVIDFEKSDVTLYNSKIILNKNTQPIDVQKAFPESSKLMSGSGSQISGFILIHASTPNGPYFCGLIFRAGRLRKMMLYTVPVFE